MSIDPQQFRMPAALYRYWTTGPGGREIRWGTDGDLTRCARELRGKVPRGSEYPTCQNIHIRFLGYPNPRD